MTRVERRGVYVSSTAMVFLTISGVVFAAAALFAVVWGLWFTGYAVFGPPGVSPWDVSPFELWPGGQVPPVPVPEPTSEFQVA